MPMVPKDLTKDIVVRLKSIQGQVGGIIKMLDNNDDPEKITTQFKAVDQGIETAHQLLLDEVYRKALALKIVEVTESCPGDCGKEENIEFIKNQFPDFKPEEIPKKLKEVKGLQEHVNNYMKK